MNRSTFVDITLLLLLTLSLPVNGGDNLALLSATLKTYQRAGCDREMVTLSCPRGTSISIEVAQYGKSGGDGPENELCPLSTEETLLNSLASGTEIEIKRPESCTWPNALQYSLLQTVVEACQKKRHCKFQASPKTFGGDPCPGVRKFVEVAYKCRPYEFRSKVACENDVVQLMCNPYSRIAIYSASYGRTEYESLQCAQPQGVKEETCLVSYATETVMQICHGRRKCNLSADSNTFGKPCRPDSRMYLKVVYTCVPRKVLKDRYDSPPEPDEPSQSDLEPDQDDLYDDDQFYRESEAIPPAPKLQSNPAQNRPSDTPSVLVTTSSGLIPTQKANNDLEAERDTKVIGFFAEWMSAYIFVAQNQERFYLYLIISMIIGVLLCLVLVIGRLIIQKRRDKNENNFKTSSTGETTLPNGFSDEISEIDADIDLTTPVPVPSVSRGNEPNYPTYTPSPSPYGNLGPSNLSHTSSTMLVPNSMIGGPPPSIIGGAPNMMPATITSSMGMIPSTGMSTLPRHLPPQQYLTGSIMGHTLRRPSHEVDSNVPRSLSRGIASNAQYYYG